MALTKIQAGSFEAGAIETADLSSNTTAAFAVSLTPKVTTVNVANSSYIELDDTAVSTNGGYVIITGSDFQSGAVVLVDTTQATSTTYVNSTTLRAQLPAKSAATYNIYVVNPDGGVGIKLNGVNYSATPTWVTTSPLANVLTDTAFTGTFEATGATSYSVDSGSSLPDGMTLVGANGYYYGTITVANDTTYSFTINATDAENQDSPATFNLTAVAAVLDDYFNSTVLLLQGDGTNGAQNQTFVDSSTNNFTITRNGNATQGSFSPFSPTGWSIYVPAGGSYSYNQGLSAPASSNYAFGTGDFTVETWYMQFSTPASDSCILTVGDGSNPHGWQFNCSQGGSPGGNRLGWAWWGTYYTSADIPEFQNNRWYHVAVTRSGGTTRLFVDGVLYYSFSDSRDYNVSKTLSTQSKADMIISNARIVKGTALYTSNFTPSTTPLTAVSGTTFLIGQDNRLIDNSTAAATITRYGSTRVLPYSPFAPAEAYSPATHGGSAYFDGAGDELTLGTNSILDFGTGNFTIEAWVWYPADVGTNNNEASIISNGGSFTTGSIRIGITPSGGMRLFLNGAGDIIYDTDVVYTSYLEQWIHWAVVRSGNTFTLYKNGVSVSTGTYSGSINFGGTGTRIGGNWASTGMMKGYISNFRAVKGTALYTSNFTPPTTAPTTIANTSLLLNFTNAGIYDATAKNVLETVGNAQVSTSVKKYGTGSMYFDGTGDYLILQDSSLLKYGFGDFTIEFWINVPGVQTSGNSWVAAISKRATSSLDGTWAIDFAANTTDLRYRLLNATGGTVSVTIGSLTTNQWYHVAVSKENGTTRTYLNGVASGTTTSNVVALDGSTEPIRIGWDNTSDGFNGYIDDLRITKGIARYTSNFTPPTAALPIQ